MLRKRVIPSLLLQGRRLVKTRRFSKPGYLGDPINAVRIFNEKEVDELLLMDIDASKQGKEPDYGYLAEIVAEAFVPITYAGGIQNLEMAQRILSLGVEKIAVNSLALRRPEALTLISSALGSQCLVGVIDVRRDLWGRYRVHSHCGLRPPELDPPTWARKLEVLGAGEILVQSVDRDGMFSGLDRRLAARFSEAVSVPWLMAGGTQNTREILDFLPTCGASGLAVGAAFAYYGPHKAVLLSYLSREEQRVLHGWNDV